ncbi:MAG: S41 family peptidase [Planctomycetaceae bacterium]
MLGATSRTCGLFLAILVFACPAFAQQTAGKVDERLKDNYELMRMFAETFEQIDQNYVKDLDRRELVEAAIEGMLQRLDPYSTYIPRTAMDRFNQSVEQEYGGIGIQVNVDRFGRLVVFTPLPGGPAFFAGVQAGDIIMKIDGESTEGLGMAGAISKLKGPRGGEVVITVKRGNADADTPLEDITLVRDIVQLDTVRGDVFVDGKWDFMLDKDQKIGYLRLSHFSRNSATEMRVALDSLRNQKMKGLILDLRDNPGGLLQQAVAISDMFVEEGMIVSTKGRSVQEQSWSAKKEGTYADFPIAVLVNRTSASASEIVSACLQDHERAVIVGERSWGKGSVQNVINLDEGRSALKLTTASYFRPSGRNIHRFPNSKDGDEWGVSPTEGYEAKLSRQQLRDWREARRERDVIREREPETQESPSFVDTQLDKAREYVLSKINGGQAEKKKDGETPEPPSKSGE